MVGAEEAGMEEVLVLPTETAAESGLMHADGWASYNVAARDSGHHAVRAYLLRGTSECAIYDGKTLMLECLSGSYREWLDAKEAMDVAALVRIMTEGRQLGYPKELSGEARRCGRRMGGGRK